MAQLRTLPAIANDADFERFMDSGPVQAVLDAIGGSLGLGTLKRPTRGSVLVGLTETEVLKVFPPHETEHAALEVACLRALQGELPVRTAELIDQGVCQGWPWILMQRLPGQELAEAWPNLSHPHRLALATQLGEALKVLHALPAPQEVPRVDWAAWCAERLPRLEQLQRQKGCPEPLLDGLQTFVKGCDLGAGQTGWLHTEIMREHLLVEMTSRGPRLSGLFDFEPSWVGPVDYEYGAVGLFFSAGQPDLLHAVQRAAGREIDPERLFALTMMHRYAHLGWYHRRLGGPTDHAALARAWFAVNPGPAHVSVTP